MQHGNCIVVAADDQGGAGDLMQLVEGDMRLVVVQIDDLLPGLCLRGARLFEQAFVLIFDQVKYVGCKAERIGCEVGAGERHFLYLVGMADGE